MGGDGDGAEVVVPRRSAGAGDDPEGEASGYGDKAAARGRACQWAPLFHHHTLHWTLLEPIPTCVAHPLSPWGKGPITTIPFCST